MESVGFSDLDVVTLFYMYYQVQRRSEKEKNSVCSRQVSFSIKKIKYRDYRKNTSAYFSMSCSPCIFVISIDKVVSLLEARITYTAWIIDVSNSVKCK